MLIEEHKDHWICSYGNWVNGGFSWCPECCEDQYVRRVDEQEEQEWPYWPADS